jgi:hypothetical protein
MLNLDSELIRLLHRERFARLTAARRHEPASERRRPALPAPRRGALRLRRPQVRLREDM